MTIEKNIQDILKNTAVCLRYLFGEGSIIIYQPVWARVFVSTRDSYIAREILCFVVNGNVDIGKPRCRDV